METWKPFTPDLNAVFGNFADLVTAPDFKTQASAQNSLFLPSAGEEESAPAALPALPIPTRGPASSSAADAAPWGHGKPRSDTHTAFSADRLKV